MNEDTAAHEPDQEQDAAQHWNGRYGERERMWSGAPNRALVETVGDLAPGQALDLGCGEGADSVWLAAGGWQVTGVDVSSTAIERAGELASKRGVSDQTSWIVTDLATWTPPEAYDLVSACFLHSHVEFPRAEVLQRAAEAVAPGGYLLVVGHAEPPPWSTQRHDGNGHDRDHDLLTPAQELASLDLDETGWETVLCQTSSRQATGPDGEDAVLEDVVVLVRRVTSQ